MKIYLNELLKRKDLLLYLVTSGLKARHRNSLLGYLWWLLDPLLGFFVYYFVVVIIFHRGGDDYGVFLVIGLTVWRWLNTTISAAAKSIVSQGSIISQVYLPKIIFPMSVTLAELIHFGFGLVVIAIFFVFFAFLPGSAIVWLPYITLMQLLFSLAIASILAYVCVFVRDIDTLVNHLVRLWFFGSPVIWSEKTIPERGRWLLEMNPMAHFLTSYRGILMENSRPDYLALLWIGLLSVCVIVSMVYFYSRREHLIIKAL
jgi:lipopolysaccharide transport system permease protein/teichoic acid transport system permease protein